MYQWHRTPYYHGMADLATTRSHDRWGAQEIGNAVPPHTYFLISAVFHYLGPAFAVLLFSQVSVLGVYWLRVATAATIFAVWRRPWRIIGGCPWSQRWTLLALGIVLGLMNASFYLAIARLQLGTVGAIEFLGPVALAAIGVRSGRNLVSLGLAIGGVAALTKIRLEGEPLGFVFAFANCALFTLYIVLGHRLAQDAGSRVDRLAAAMLVALVVATPIGLADALPALLRPALLLAGVGVGVCSSVIPYICDQLAMARLSRATFALMLALLPACAAAIGFLVLRQTPRPAEIVGIASVIAAVAIHRPASEPRADRTPHPR
jgi:inner membrane transporter RhtA